MSNLKQLTSEVLRELIGFVCLSKATLAINDTAAATFKTTGTTTYISDGIFKTKAALSAQAFSSGHAVQAAGETGYYVVGLNSAGTVKTFQGIGAMPDVDDGYTPIGMIKVVCGSAAFTPGTTALDAANITFTFYDLSLLPSVAP